MNKLSRVISPGAVILVVPSIYSSARPELDRSPVGASAIKCATPCLNANVSWPACVGERH